MTSGTMANEARTPMLPVTRSIDLTSASMGAFLLFLFLSIRKTKMGRLRRPIFHADSFQLLTLTVRQPEAPFHRASSSFWLACTLANHGYLFSLAVFSAQSRPILRPAYCTSGESSMMVLPAFLKNSSALASSCPILSQLS